LSSAGTRTRYTTQRVPVGNSIRVDKWVEAGGKLSTSSKLLQTGKQITVSESHPVDRKTGNRLGGGPFFTSRVNQFISPGHTDNAYLASQAKVYTGPVYGQFPSLAEMKSIGYKNIEQNFGSKNESSMMSDGTTAISRCNPINPASQLGTGLSESYLEGIPTLPGIQTWRQRTEFLKGLGSEYLNYIFGWAPLKDEVESVVSAARQHRDLLSQYHRGEGSNTHRTYEFPSNSSESVGETSNPSEWSGLPWSWTDNVGTRRVHLVNSTRRWFEGCFTYGLPSQTDSWGKALGFGSDADQLFGLALSPDILWELTPWSWAVDWFSNAGDVINNVTNFGLAGLVMRYGYMMEESIEKVYAEGSGPSLVVLNLKSQKKGEFSESRASSGAWSCGYETVTKRRVPASPFGFSVGWEGLSPTQLAITAALGITRLL